MKKTSVFQNSLIWFGAGVSIAEILTGTYFAPLGMAKGFAAILLGHLIGCTMMFFAGLIGGRTGLSAMETSKLSFGKKGSLWFAALNVLQLVGWTLLGLLITVCTLGICLPWAYCIVYRWEAKHTVINGHRLAFDGTAMQLFGKWLLWLLLTIVTVGIYSFWVNIKLKKWKVQHTRFAD